MLNRCVICKHWSRNTDPYENSNYGDCSCSKFFDTHGYEGPVPPIDGLETWDYEGFSSGFKTGFAFGCIHYKPIDKGDLK